jgi:DNA helicase-2/ATP-dependent DNA helicase PcrA
LDPQDVEAFSKIYYRMNRYISKAMLECALAGNCSKPVIDCIMNGIDLKPFQINGLQELKQEFANLAKKRPWSALEYIKNNFNYLDSVKEYCEIVGLSYEYLCRLYGILQEIAFNCQTIVEFLDRLSELDSMFEGNTSTDYESEDCQITLSTLHSSKGLEYDSVFMIDLMNSEIPGEKALEKALEIKDLSLLEEERRLFYVGMTRAKKELYLLCPDQQDNNKLMVSTFVKEVSQLLNNEVVSGLGEGAVVRHEKFGRGVVINSSTGGPTIEIKFLNGVVKKLDLQICLESKLLSIE